jgi:hypothetical protein
MKGQRSTTEEKIRILREADGTGRSDPRGRREIGRQSVAGTSDFQTTLRKLSYPLS